MKHYRFSFTGKFIAVLLLLFSPSPAGAAAREVHTAVSSNFLTAMAIIARDFERETGARVYISSASSGLLYAQIAGGERFDLFFSADEGFPLHLEQKGLTEPGSRFSYAVGRLALYASKKEAGEINGKTLANAKFSKLAISQPSISPYGRASAEVIEEMGLSEKLSGKIAVTASEEQSFWMVASGGADVGFVALSKVTGETGAKGSFWIVPENLHAPIVQQAVLLKGSAGNPDARALMDYMKSTKAQAVMKTLGYTIPINSAPSAAAASGK